MEEAMESLSKAIQIQVEATSRHQNLKNLFSPADGEFFEKFAAGRELVGIGELRVTVEPTPVVIERTEARQYLDDPANDLVLA